MRRSEKMVQKKKRFPLGIIIYVVCFLLFLSLFIYSVYLYVHLDRTKHMRNAEIEDFLLQRTNINKIEEIYHFQEEKPYKIVFAKTKEDEERILFIDLAESLDEKAIYTIDRSQYLSQNDIETKWKENCERCTMKQSQPAFINRKPLWEITYVDEEDRYYMTYYSLKDGSIYEQMKFTRKYSKKDD